MVGALDSITSVAGDGDASELIRRADKLLA
jgi:hypothetical protein